MNEREPLDIKTSSNLECRSNSCNNGIIENKVHATSGIMASRQKK